MNESNIDARSAKLAADLYAIDKAVRGYRRKVAGKESWAIFSPPTFSTASGDSPANSPFSRAASLSSAASPLLTLGLGSSSPGRVSRGSAGVSSDEPPETR